MEILREWLSDSEGADNYWKMEGTTFTPCMSLKFFEKGESFGRVGTLQKGQFNCSQCNVNTKECRYFPDRCYVFRASMVDHEVLEDGIVSFLISGSIVAASSIVAPRVTPALDHKFLQS